MAKLTLTIPDNAVDRIQDAICEKYGYTGFLDRDNTLPQTKPEFVKTWIINTVKTAVKEHEGSTAASVAYSNASLDVDNIAIT